MTRRREFARLLPIILGAERGGDPLSLLDIYKAVERDAPDLVDDELEVNTGASRWKHELRWELETLVGAGLVRRRKDLGRGVYSR